jgi:SAM-dependent methyltransferase
MGQQNITEFDGLDLELFFCTEILKLNSLHYGYWEESEKPTEGDNKLTLECLRDGQQKYTDMLIEAIPKNVKSILDVGCGIGDVSRTLSKLEYDVTAISPDSNHAKYFENHLSKLTFLQTKFEDLDIDSKFDLILMSESQNYFPTEIGFRQCTSFLLPKGYLLVAGMFRKDSNSKIAEVPNTIEDYAKAAEKHRLLLIENVDITENILPTIDFIYESMQNYVEPGAKMLSQFISSIAPLKSWFIKIIFRKQINKTLQIYDYYRKRTNPLFFEKNIVYARLLFQYNV